MARSSRRSAITGCSRSPCRALSQRRLSSTPARPRLSSRITSSPSDRSASARFEPMKPAPPVMTAGRTARESEGAQSPAIDRTPSTPSALREPREELGLARFDHSAHVVVARIEPEPLLHRHVARQVAPAIPVHPVGRRLQRPRKAPRLFQLVVAPGGIAGLGDPDLARGIVPVEDGPHLAQMQIPPAPCALLAVPGAGEAVEARGRTVRQHAALAHQVEPERIERTGPAQNGGLQPRSRTHQAAPPPSRRRAGSRCPAASPSRADCWARSRARHARNAARSGSAHGRRNRRRISARVAGPNCGPCATATAACNGCRARGRSRGRAAGSASRTNPSRRASRSRPSSGACADNARRWWPDPPAPPSTRS